MMNSSAFLPLAFLANPFAGFSAATDPPFDTHGFTNPVIGPSAGGGATCISGTVTVAINTTGTKLLYEAPQDQLAATEALVELFQADMAFAAHATAGGPSVIAGEFDIFAKLCLPPPSSSSASPGPPVRTVQLLTHGATLDHGYWDLAPPGHSYADAAAAAGHATLAYDQLGVGRSAHPDPVQTVQAAAQAAVLQALAERLRGRGRGPGLAGRRFARVVGVGHSAGSTLTQAVAAREGGPRLLDAVLATGTSADAAGVPLALAALNLVVANTLPAEAHPGFARLPPGYLAPATAAGVQLAFYRHPGTGFDAGVFAAQAARRQTNTLGVLLTLGDLAAVPAAGFAGPVAVVNGERDLVFCGGDCRRRPPDRSLEARRAFYPAAAPPPPGVAPTYLATGAGHAIAAHRSAPDSFRYMLRFLQAHGL
ncbi:alpha/beta-hydrolase [Xylariomycetidae sp. FL0641]|nr:alpha/beta-hydrolase [Xylariomycetidae sp. FL0641]